LVAFALDLNVALRGETVSWNVPYRVPLREANHCGMTRLSSVAIAGMQVQMTLTWASMTPK
jgi:hypothetical protein